MKDKRLYRVTLECKGGDTGSFLQQFDVIAYGEDDAIDRAKYKAIKKGYCPRWLGRKPVAVQIGANRGKL